MLRSKTLGVLVAINLSAICSIYAADAATVDDAEKLTRAGKYRAAMVILNATLAEDENNVRAHELRQECCIKLWKPDIALSDLLFLKKREPTNAKWSGQMAEAFQLIDQNDRLVASLTDAARLAPTSIYWDALHAWQCQIKKDYPNAAKAWIKCIGLHPQNAFSRLSRATMFEKMGKRADAIKDLNAVKRDREDLRPYALLSLWYSNSAQIPEALKVATEMEKVNKTAGITARASIYSYIGDYHNALVAWGEVIKLEPKEPNWRINRAKAYVDSGNYREALQDFHYALNLSIRNKEKKAEMLQQLAMVHERMNEYNRAIAFYTEAITTHSAHEYIFLVGRARCHMAMRKKEAAIKDLERAIKLKPGRSEALIAMGEVHANDDRWDLAEPYFMRGIRIGFSNKELFESLFNLYLKKPDETKAKIVLDHWKIAVPNDPTPYMKAARLAHDKGRFDEALKQYGEALDHRATPWMVYSSRAKLLRKLGRIDDAIADYSKLVLLEPSNRPIDWYVSRAECYLKKGDTKAALADYNKALSFGSKYNVYYGRAALYERLNRHSEALADVEQAIKLNTKDSEARSLKAKILSGLGSYAEARREYTALILKLPGVPTLYRERAKVLEKLGEKEKAQKDLKMAAELERK